MDAIETMKKEEEEKVEAGRDIIIKEFQNKKKRNYFESSESDKILKKMRNSAVRKNASAGMTALSEMMEE